MNFHWHSAQNSLEKGFKDNDKYKGTEPWWTSFFILKSSAYVLYTHILLSIYVDTMLSRIEKCLFLRWFNKSRKKFVKNDTFQLNICFMEGRIIWIQEHSCEIGQMDTVINNVRWPPFYLWRQWILVCKNVCACNRVAKVVQSQATPLQNQHCLIPVARSLGTLETMPR